MRIKKSPGLVMVSSQRTDESVAIQYSGSKKPQGTFGNLLDIFGCPKDNTIGRR